MRKFKDRDIIILVVFFYYILSSISDFYWFRHLNESITTLNKSITAEVIDLKTQSCDSLMIVMIREQEKLLECYRRYFLLINGLNEIELYWNYPDSNIDTLKYLKIDTLKYHKNCL